MERRIQQVLIPCNVSPGMFDNEYMVEIIAGGEKISLFADQSLVHTIDGKSFLQVNLIENDSTEDEKPVLLPSESFEKGSRWLRMPKDQLVAA